jgi:signal transduction histidine kinase
MTPKSLSLPPFLTSLSARLLVLTIFFIMLSEVLIFAPSVGRYRLGYLENRIASARLAVLALEATPDNMVSQALANELLAQVGARGVVLRRAGGPTLMIDSDMPPTIDATFDLRQTGFFAAITDAFDTLAGAGNRVLRVLGPSPRESDAEVELLLDERPMRREMAGFALRILQLSLVISLITAALVYLSLQWLLVRPMRRITAAMMAFRADPEDASRVIAPSARRDEVGFAERELAELQETVRQALAQRAHLAALGTAVTKINHDLRGILSTARLLSDGLAGSAAPEVRRIAPNLLDAIDRAVALCTQTLDYTREGAPPLHRTRFALARLVDEVAAGLGLPRSDGAAVVNEVSARLIVAADRDQIYRAIANLCRNALESGAHRVTMSARLEDGVTIDVADDGPGLPPKARENLFKPFAGSARRGGTGLGLAIARELLRAHGGDIALVESAGSGTVFRLVLPHGEAGAAVRAAQWHHRAS